MQAAGTEISESFGRKCTQSLKDIKSRLESPMPSVLLYMPANKSHFYWADYTAPSTPWALLNLIHYTANSCSGLPRAVEDAVRKKRIKKKKK